MDHKMLWGRGEMPLLKINVCNGAPVLDGPDELHTGLAQAIADLPQGAPVLVLIHGYRFSPDTKRSNPHHHILAMNPDARFRKAVSWPRHMGFGRGAADEGLCIAFGWPASGSIWKAWDHAADAGAVLANLVQRLHAMRRGPVDILCHSLGARVALSAMNALPSHSIGRVVLLAAAEFQSDAEHAMAGAAGQTAEVVNITSRENDLFDGFMEWFVRAPQRGDCALGAGLHNGPRNWLDIQMDCDATRAALVELGYRIPAPARRICHWSAYMRPGLFGLYRDLIRNRHALPLACLRHLLPDQPEPRWARLLSLPKMRIPRPMWRPLRP
jgi:hypothetical protein